MSDGPTPKLVLEYEQAKQKYDELRQAMEDAERERQRAERERIQREADDALVAAHTPGKAYLLKSGCYEDIEVECVCLDPRVAIAARERHNNREDSWQGDPWYIEDCPLVAGDVQKASYPPGMTPGIAQEWLEDGLISQAQYDAWLVAEEEAGGRPSPSASYESRATPPRYNEPET